MRSGVRSLPVTGLPPSGKAYCSMMNAFGRARDIDGAERYFKKMQEADIAPDRVAYSIMVNAHATLKDLSGAERWLATIPNAARAKVWAYQISPKGGDEHATYEHSCNRITNMYFDDEPCNDAVVSCSSATLPGGNNEPVPGEWCHPSLLRYPGIISNSELNKKMDTWAARG